MRKCAQCNTLNSNDENICIYCGGPINARQKSFVRRIIDRIASASGDVNIYRHAAFRPATKALSLNVFIYRLINSIILLTSTAFLLICILSAAHNENPMPSERLSEFGERISSHSRGKITVTRGRISAPETSAQKFAVDSRLNKTKARFADLSSEVAARARELTSRLGNHMRIFFTYRLPDAVDDAARRVKRLTGG